MIIETFTYKNGVGWSVNCFPELDSDSTLVLAFCASEFLKNTSALTELNNAYPHSCVTGCSTAGEIYRDIISDHSISVAVIKFEKSAVALVEENIQNVSYSFEAGKNLATKLKRIQLEKKENLKSVIVFSNGLTINGSMLVEGLKQNLPHTVIVTGGLAGDGNRFKETWVLKNDLPNTSSVVAIGLYGESIEIGYGSQAGWDPFGPERVMTRSEGNILYEIDGQPALALYKKYLGDRAQDLPASGLLFPLAIRDNTLSEKQVVRTILSVNEDNQSITFAGDIPQGWYGQLMKADHDRLIEGASLAGQLANSQIPAPKKSLNIAISCVGRRLVLGERSEEEVEATLDMLSKDSDLIGFYSYGEISPSGLNSCDLHNQTMTVTSISEK